MNKIWLAALVALAVTVAGYCAEPGPAVKGFGGVVSETGSSTAVVEAINYKTREITLKNSEGEVITLVAGPEVRNFAQIKKGDKVNATYSETVKIMITGETSVPMREDTVELERAPLGAKPAGLITAATQVRATVEAVDYANRILTLKGPQRTVIIEADKSAVNFENVKVGDTVLLEYIGKLAISVVTP
jgi:hypothetical protein